MPHGTPCTCLLPPHNARTQVAAAAQCGIRAVLEHNLTRHGCGGHLRRNAGRLCMCVLGKQIGERVDAVGANAAGKCMGVWLCVFCLALGWALEGIDREGTQPRAVCARPGRTPDRSMRVCHAQLLPTSHAPHTTDRCVLQTPSAAVGPR